MTYDFQISTVSGCGLIRKGDLGFSFRYGTCGCFMTPSQDENLLLCFDMDNKSSCRHYNGDFDSNRNRYFKLDLNGSVWAYFLLQPLGFGPCKCCWNIEWSSPMLTSETNHLHYISKLASYKDKPFIVGHFEYFAGNNKAELLDLQTNSWSQMADYPFHESWVGPSDGHRDWRCDIIITLANLAFKVFILGPPRTAHYNFEFSINGYSAISMKDSVIIFGGDTIGLSITVTL